MNKPVFRYIAPVVLSLLMAGSALAQGSKAIAIVLTAKGNAEVKKPGNDWTTLKFGVVLDDGDQIRTGDDGFVALAFTDDKSQLKIRPDTEITVNAQRQADYSLAKRVNMELGELFADVKKQKGSMQVATPTSVASVKGTSFWVLVDENGETNLLAIEGLIQFLNLISNESIDVSGGTTGFAGTDGSLETGSLEGMTIPEFLEETLGFRTIEIIFTDDEGNTKRLIINYQVEGEE